MGIDILIDEHFNGWLVEVNANPSLNIYNDKELPNGDIEQTLSELDKYVKSMLVSDTLKVVTVIIFVLYQCRLMSLKEKFLSTAV